MRRYLVGRHVLENPFTLWRKSLLFPRATGWKELGNIFVGSSIIFRNVQSLLEVVRKTNEGKERERVPMSYVVGMHELHPLVR